MRSSAGFAPAARVSIVGDASGEFNEHPRGPSGYNDGTALGDPFAPPRMNPYGDFLIGRIALERGLVSVHQLADCLSDQQGSASADPLGTIMLRKGLITQRDLDTLLEEQKKRLAEALELSDPKLEDALLGRLLIRQGLVKEAQVYECLRASAELGESGQKAPRLGELLVRKGFLTPDLSRRLVPPDRQGETTEMLRREMPEEAVRAARDPARQFAGGKYLLVQEAGRGGMGVVWKAWQPDLRRWVAVKILAGTLWTDVELKRFYREAQMAASLSHPNIASIYEVGAHEGKHYIAMEFVDGDSLARLMAPASGRQGTTRAARPLSPRRAIEILREAALAVDYAHSKGIIHRDLKPHNIMVQRSDGRVYVMDFGLAKPLRPGDSISMSDAIVGTPQYMSPEQARGDAVDRRTDVFSLGAVLFHVLAGRPPFEGHSPAEVMMSVLADDPPSLRRLNPRVHADVETICMKALEKDRGRRYESARGLADDLGRYLEGEPISARPLSARERLWKAARRRPILSALAGAALVAAALLGLGLWGLGLEKRAKIEEFARQAQEAFRAGRYDEAMTLWDKALALDPEDPEALRGWSEAADRGRSERQERERDRRLQEQLIQKNHREAEILLKAGKYQEALNLTFQILAFDPNDADAQRRRRLCEAELEKERARQEALREDLDQVLRARQEQEEAQKRQRLARIAAFADYEKAREAVEAAASMRLAADGLTITDVLARLQEAREALGRALEKDPTYAEAYHYRGQVKHRMGEYDLAERDFVEALKHSSDSGPAAFGAAVSQLALYMLYAHVPYAPEGRLQTLDPAARDAALARMLAWARQAVSADNRNEFQRWCAKALIELHQAQYVRAEEALRTVEREGRSSYFWHFLLACVLMERGEWRAAHQELTLALDLRPASLESLFLRAVARFRTEDLAGALEDAHRAVEAAPKSSALSALVYLLRAHVLHEIAHPQAVADLHHASRHAPALAPKVTPLLSRWTRGR